MAGVREEKKKATHANGSGLWSRALLKWRWLWTETEDPEPGVVFAPADLNPMDEADSSESETSESFTNLVPFKIIAWLGASASGLTILLVVLGFLASSAHDVMLGIPRSIQEYPEYVAVGGLFFGRSIIFLVASFISVKSWIVLGILVIGVIVVLKTAKRRSRGRSLLIILFGIALLAGEVYGLAQLIRPLQISNLLLNVSAGANTPAKPIVDALLVNDRTWLSVEYGFLVLLGVAFSVAFLLLGQASRTRFWHLVRVPALTLLIIYVFLLPRAYGVLTMSNEYPTVVLESESPTSGSPGTPANETRLLLREDDKVFVLYDPASQSIGTVKRESIVQHKMYAPQHVFTATTARK